MRAKKRLGNDTDFDESITAKKKVKINEKAQKYPSIEQDAEDHVRALKHEHLTEEAFLYHWQNCCGYRINFIQNSSVHDVFQKWPQYKQSNGYQLVSNERFIIYSYYTCRVHYFICSFIRLSNM